MKSRSDVNKMTPNMLVSWFMIGSFVYYRLGKKVMKDKDFDHLVNRLKAEWDNADHYHKALIKPSHLEAATGYDIKYPKIVKYSAYGYLREINADR